VSGFLSFWLIDAAVWLLHVVLPARNVSGYVRDDTGQPLRYRLNGLWVFVTLIALWAVACRDGLLAWDAFYVERWRALSGAVVLGLVFSVAMARGSNARGVGARLRELYLGRRPNPQWWRGRVDAKMLLYLVGAVGLELNLLSCAAHQWLLTNGHPPVGVVAYVALFSFFLVDYLFFEEVHLYTYDFVAESVGFKLGWGCIAFYPFFYAVGLEGLAGQPFPSPSVTWEVCAVGLFFGGWFLSRGANLQKYWFKKEPTRHAFGLLAPEALTGPDGRRVLVSGFWGLSRHVNYLGELLMATGLALSLGPIASIWPWLYPLYYVALLVPRQLDDDKRCAAKYGALWEQYRARVPRRIIPFVY
jgi:hypothetical protein